MADGNQALLRELPTPAALRGAAPSAPPAVRADQRRKLIRWSLLILGPLLLVLIGGTLYLRGGRYVSIDDAYVKADMVNVANDVSGMVVEVAVHNNDQVVAGQVLFRLDDEPFRIALAMRRPSSTQVRNDIDALKASYRQKQADVRDRPDQHRRSTSARTSARPSWSSKSFSSRVQYDTAHRNLDLARQRLASDQQQLAGLVANLGGDPNIAPEAASALSADPGAA
ncbi:MAG: biotin/lipoyl-binding protein [Pseudomonadota bacterium]